MGFESRPRGTYGTCTRLSPWRPFIRPEPILQYIRTHRRFRIQGDVSVRDLSGMDYLHRCDSFTLQLNPSQKYLGCSRPITRDTVPCSLLPGLKTSMFSNIDIPNINVINIVVLTHQTSTLSILVSQTIAITDGHSHDLSERFTPQLLTGVDK